MGAADRPTRVLWLLAVGLFCLVAAVVVTKVWPFLFPQPVATLLADPSCQLRAGPCRSPIPGGAVTFSIQTPGIPLMRPLDLLLQVEQRPVQAVDVDFIGSGMDMGLNRVRLQESRPGYFTGNATLPVCSQQRMQWQARVLLHVAEGIIAVPFQFYTERDQGG